MIDQLGLTRDERNGFHESQLQTIEGIEETITYVKSHPDDRWGRSRVILDYDAICTGIRIEAGANETVDELLLTGSYRGNRIDVPLLPRRAGGWSDEWPHMGQYLRTAEAMLQNRITFARFSMYAGADSDSVFGSEIVALHGTNGLQLPDILGQQALLSHQEQFERQMPVGSGEPYVRSFRRRFVSFDELASTIPLSYAEQDLRSVRYREYIDGYAARGYGGAILRAAELRDYDVQVQARIAQGDKYTKQAEAQRFGVVVGLCHSGLVRAGIDAAIGRKVQVVDADEPEIAFADFIGLKYLRCVGVPDANRDLVESLISESDPGWKISVFSLSALQKAHSALPLG